jgi:hypothetical protein
VRALYLLDGDLSVQLQTRRPDLYFLHSAVLARHGLAALLVGPSGIGKSTAAWALTHHGFQFKGDELAPVDVERLRVFPYFRALCLKTLPPASYPVARTARRTSRGWHVPAHLMPGGRRATPLKVGAVFFPRRDSPPGASAVRRISQADAAARLYAYALNALAHEDAGLAPAARLAQAVPAFEVITTDLVRAASGVSAVLARQAQKKVSR